MISRVILELLQRLQYQGQYQILQATIVEMMPVVQASMAIKRHSPHPQQKKCLGSRGLEQFDYNTIQQN